MTSSNLQHDPLAFGGVGARLARTPAWIVGGASVILVFAIGGLDYLSGPDVVMSMLYLVPLSAAAWRMSLPFAMGVSVVASVVWLASDLLSGADFSHTIVPVWNTTTRLVIFLLIVVLLARLRDALRAQTRLASIDSLTEVANPRSFDQAAADAIVAARTTRRPLSVAYVDLDDFKNVNDTLGHSGGDHVLRLMAKALTDKTRTTDIVGRLGGDEFAIVLPATSSAEAVAMVKGLTARLADALHDVAVPVTFSAGVVTFLTVPDDVDGLLRPADALMYEAKADGKAAFRHLIVGTDESDSADVPIARNPARRG